MKLSVPELSLVVLVGPSGSGKSTFARRHFRPTEVLSSDFCRGLVSDDENDQGATNDAFEVLHFVARKRLAAGKLTVIDATNVQPEARKPLVELAREFHCLPVAIVLDVPEKACAERNKSRPERQFGFALYVAQRGGKHPSAKPLKGFGGAGVLEVVDDYDGNAYRTVYTVKLAGAVYVLHAVQKKSRRGVDTPPEEIELVRRRLKRAQEHAARRGRP
jgi:protein phosphatase